MSCITVYFKVVRMRSVFKCILVVYRCSHEHYTIDIEQYMVYATAV